MNSKPMLFRALAILLVSVVVVGLTSLLLGASLYTWTNLVSVLSLTLIFTAASYRKSVASRRP